MTDLEKVMFQHLYQLYEKYHCPMTDDRYWSSLINDANWVVKQYRQTELGDLVNKLVLELLGHLEEKYKRSVA